MSYHGQSFANRFAAMGDAAEQAFEELYPKKKDRYGHNRPQSSMARWPVEVRATPDYITSDCFVECKGFGRDGVVKLDAERLDVMAHWQHLLPVKFFLWDSHKRRWTILPLFEVTWCARHEGDTGRWGDNGKPYYAVPAERFNAEWTDAPPV